MAKAKEDHSERVNKATAIKADIAKTLDAVIDANNVLQVINNTDNNNREFIILTFCTD